MKFFLILLFLLCAKNLKAETSEDIFGYISSSTSNVGDDIQSIAARRFLPKNCIGIDRDLIHEFNYEGKVKTIVSGWFMHTKIGGYWERFDVKAPEKSWPPQNMIEPLLISMHITGTFIPQAFSEEGVKYFKENGPIGARDLYTLNELQQRNIPSYFSGCLTLTLENFEEQRDDIIYLVDVDNEACINYIKSKTKSKVVVMTHGRPILLLLNNEQRLKYAENILNLYRRAKCVVTTRMHAALPCLAFKTPVLFVGSQYEPRLSGMIEHLHHATREEVLKGKVAYDFNNPPENFTSYLPIRENLIHIVSEWVKKHAEMLDKK